MSEPLNTSSEEQGIMQAYAKANRYFDTVDYVYPQALDLSAKFGKLALGFAELIPLSTKQIAILDGISHGMTKGEASASIGVASFSSSEITKPLEVKTVNQAIIKSYEQGLLPPYKDEIKIGHITKALMETWKMLCAGMSKEEIAVARNVTVGTISDLFGKLFSEIGARSQQHAIRIGLEEGIGDVVPNPQGQANRALMAASALTADKLYSLVPLEDFPDDVMRSELPPLALGTIFRGTKNHQYKGKFKKRLNLNRIGALSADLSPEEILTENNPGDEHHEPIDEKTAREKLLDLPEQEREVAFLIAAGFRNTEIAQRLMIGAGAVLGSSNTIRAFLGVRTNSELAAAIGPVTLEEIPPAKTEQPESKEAQTQPKTELTGKTKFMWEDEYDKQLAEVIKTLVSSGADAQTKIPVTEGNQPALELLTREGHISEGAGIESFEVVDLITAMMLKTYQGKHLRAGAEWKPTARRKIREAVEKQWPKKQ
jgi:DNA-binding NarL/FixJ family response regulator